MKPYRLYFMAGFMMILFSVAALHPDPVNADFLFKSYIVKKDMGRDILCDPHIVQQNESLVKLFKQKGEISYKNFREFLRIFQRINPHVQDIDKILPGQQIFIPIKKLQFDALPGQSTGVVTIPFVTITNVKEIIESHSATYEVQKGDSIFRLIDQKFRGHGKKSYQEGTKLFQLINPDIEDLNLIYPGQVIRLPEPSIRNEPWYPSLFDNKGNLIATAQIGALYPDTGSITKLPPSMPQPGRSVAPLDQTAALLKATLSKKGTYYFPRKGKADLALNIAEIPFLSLKDGSKILFPGKGSLSDQDLGVIKSFWKRIRIVPKPPKMSVEQLLDAISEAINTFSPNTRISFFDGNVKLEVRSKWLIEQPAEDGKTVTRICITPIDRPEERIHSSMNRYLAKNNIVIKEIVGGVISDPPKAIPEKKMAKIKQFTNLRFSNNKTLIKDLSSVIGYKFSEDITVSFPYAGTQVNALTNLITRPDGEPLLVDFGNLQGDAARAIKKTGLDIIQIKSKAPLRNTVAKLLRAVKGKYTENPVFLGAKRPKIYNVSLTVPGFLVKNNQQTTL
ncbi:MAG: LysM peptidoglycan-binding domain-containing protein, partial [Desulfobacterales bacterium]